MTGLMTDAKGALAAWRAFGVGGRGQLARKNLCADGVDIGRSWQRCWMDTY